MSFAPALARSRFMKATGQEIVAALRTAGVPDPVIAPAVRQIGDRLAQLFGGDQVYVPKGNHNGDERASEVGRLRKLGCSNRQIAERMQITERRVRQLLEVAHDAGPRRSTAPAQEKP